VVEGLDSLVDPLAPMLPGGPECFAVQLARVGAQDLAAEPLDRLDLDPPRAPQPTRCLDRPHIRLERLRAGQFLHFGDFSLGGASLERLQQLPDGQFGARIGAQQR
jgi:hypothetical protein